MELLIAGLIIFFLVYYLFIRKTWFASSGLGEISYVNRMHIANTLGIPNRTHLLEDYEVFVYEYRRSSVYVYVYKNKYIIDRVKYRVVDNSIKNPFKTDMATVGSTELKEIKEVLATVKDYV